MVEYLQIAVFSYIQHRPNATFKDLRDGAEAYIRDFSNRFKKPAFHPTLYSNGRELRDYRVSAYLRDSYLDDIVDNGDNLEIKSEKDWYRNGEFVKLKIDTKGNRGYLYIIVYRDSNPNLRVAYPNRYCQESNFVNGKDIILFPNKHCGFEAINGNWRRRGGDRTTVYAILSNKKIEALEGFGEFINYGELAKVSHKAFQERPFWIWFIDFFFEPKDRLKIFIAKTQFIVE